MTLNSILNQIPAADGEAAKAARDRWDSLAKPLGSLGLLEEDIVRIAAVSGSADVSLDRRSLLVFCADNGVTLQGVSQCGSSVTASVAVALAEGCSTVSPMARLADCRVIPVDLGILDFPGAEGVLSRRVRNGTADISLGPAMSREECLDALMTGFELARRCAEDGQKILAVGEMGIGNTTTTAAVTAALLGADPDTVTGCGAGLSKEGLQRKRSAVRRALAVNRPDPGDPVDVLSKVGGLDLAAMCGVFLGGAACRLPVISDGFISSAAALCAVRLCPAARTAILASHVSSEPGSRMLLDELGLQAPLTAGMHLGEGSGAVALLPLLDMALAVYRSSQTFERLGIEAYTPQDG